MLDNFFSATTLLSMLLLTDLLKNLETPRYTPFKNIKNILKSTARLIIKNFRWSLLTLIQISGHTINPCSMIIFVGKILKLLKVNLFNLEFLAWNFQIKLAILFSNNLRYNISKINALQSSKTSWWKVWPTITILSMNMLRTFSSILQVPRWSKFKK